MPKCAVAVVTLSVQIAVLPFMVSNASAESLIRPGEIAPSTLQRATMPVASVVPGLVDRADIQDCGGGGGIF